MRTDILDKKEEILQWIEEGQSKAYMCKQLGCKQETLNSYLKKMNIEQKEVKYGLYNYRIINIKFNTCSNVTTKEY